MAFQYPLEIPGVSNNEFMKTAYNSQRQARGLEELDAVEFYRVLKEKLKVVEMDSSYVNRAVNDGLLRRRKEAQTRYCRWRCWNRPWQYSTRRTRGWISTR